MIFGASMCSRDAAGVSDSVSVAGDCAASIYPISRDEFHTAATRDAYDAAKPFGFFSGARVYIFCIIQEAPHGFQ